MEPAWYYKELSPRCIIRKEGGKDGPRHNPIPHSLWCVGTAWPSSVQLSVGWEAFLKEKSRSEPEVHGAWALPPPQIPCEA